METKPKPVIDLTNILGKPTEKAKNYSTGDVYVPGGFGSNEKNLDISNLEDINDLRGENQSTMDKIGNGAAKFIGKTALRTVGGLVTPFVGLAAMLASGKLSSVYDNGVANFLQESEEKLNEALPNYRTDEETKSLWESVKGTNFWADSLLDGASFALSAYLSGQGIGKGIGAISKALAKTGNFQEAITALKGAEEIGGDLAKLGSIGTRNRIGSALKEGLGTLAGAVNESALEAHGTFEEVRGKLMQEKLAKKQAQGDFSEINEEESKELDDQASKAANVNFGLNLAMTWGTNALQMGKLFRSYKNEAIDAAKVIGKAGEYSYDANRVGGAIQSVLDTSPRLAKALSARNRGIMNYFADDILSEAGQEFGQTYSNELVATHFAGGTGGQERSWMDDMGKALDKSLGKDGYESALLGALIGGITGGATGSLSEANRKSEDGKAAVDFANKNSLQSFVNQNQVKSFLRVNALDKQANEAMADGRKFDWMNLRTAKFHEMVMGQYEIGKFDDLISNLETMRDADPAEAKELLGLETDEDTRAEFAKGLIEKAKATKENYENLIGLVGHKIAKGEVDKDAIAQAALSGALAGDMDERMKSVKKNLNDMGFNIDSKVKDRLEAYKQDPEAQGRLGDQYSKQIKETDFSLRAEKAKGNLADPIQIDALNKTLSKLSGEKTKLADYFKNQTDNDNYIDEFDSFAKDFLNDLDEKTTRDFANNKVTPTNRQDFETQLSDYRKLEKAKKGFYDFYNDVVTEGNSSERLQKVRKLIAKKQNDNWLDRWYGVYATPQQVDKKTGEKVDSSRVQLEPGFYTYRTNIPGKKKLSAKENVVEVLDRRLNEGKPEILVKLNGQDEQWKPVRGFNAIGLQRVSSTIGKYGNEEYRNVEDLLNPEMQFYLKYKDRVIEYYQPDLGYLEKGGKVKIKSVNDMQGTGRKVRGMLAFNQEGDLVLRFYGKDGQLHTTLSGYAVNANGKLLLNAQGKKIKVPAFAVARAIPGKLKGENTNSFVNQNYMKIYSEDETNQYLFEESRAKNVTRLESYIQSIKEGKEGKDFSSIADIEAKLRSTVDTITTLSKKLKKTANPSRILKLQHEINQNQSIAWDLEQQIKTKNQIIAQVKDQIAGIEAKPDTYTFEDLQKDYQQLRDTQYEGDVQSLDDEKKVRQAERDRFNQHKAFAKQLQYDIDALELTKNKLSGIQGEVEAKITEWANKTLTGPLADQIVSEVAETVPGIQERYENNELSFDDVNAILRNITKTPAKTSFFNIAFNETKDDLSNQIKLLADTFEEEALTDLTNAYVREDAITPLLAAEEELKQIETLREELSKDYTEDQKDPYLKDKKNGIFDAGDEITLNEKSLEDLFVVPDTKHNGAYNPFFRTQTPQESVHNQTAFRATALFNSKNRFENNKYSYELFTYDQAADKGISIDRPNMDDVIFLRLINEKTGKPVMLDANGVEKSSGKYPHLSVLPDANFKYQYTDKQGKIATRYRFRDVTAENESEFEPVLAEFKGVRTSVLEDLKAGKQIKWAINRKSYGVPNYDSDPNPVKSTINDPNFMSELLKPAGLTTDGKVDYTQSGEYVMYLADAKDLTFPGTDIQYPTIPGRVYLVDKKSKRVMPLVNRKLNTDEIQNLLTGIVYTGKEQDLKVTQTSKSFRADFINLFAKNYINWGNRVSQKKLTNVGYHIDFNNDLVAPGIIFGDYTGVTAEGKGIYGENGVETAVSFAELEDYLETKTPTESVQKLLDFLQKKHRHVSNYNLTLDYKPTPGGKQRGFKDYKYVKNGANYSRYEVANKKGYKSWLLETNGLQSPIIPVRDTKAQYDSIYYTMRNEMPLTATPDPKKATTSKKKVKEVTDIVEEEEVDSTKPKSDQLLDLVKTFKDAEQVAEFITAYKNFELAEEGNRNYTDEEITLTLALPENLEGVMELLQPEDAEKYQAFLTGKTVEKKPVEVVAETKVEEVKPKETKPVSSFDDVPAVDISNPVAVGKTFNIAGITYTVQEVKEGNVMAKAGDVITSFPETALRERLKPKPIDEFPFMSYDENLAKQPKQNNVAKKAELEEYFKTRYGVKLAIVNPKKLFGNFAQYVKTAKTVLMQEETPEGAEYHEEFHIVEKALTPIKRKEIYDAYRKATSNYTQTDSEVSEALAEGFRYYVLNEKAKDNSFAGKILNFFKELKEFLQSLLIVEKSPQIKKFYADIYGGKFANKPKRFNLRASAFNVATREALVDNMWYQLGEVKKEYGFSLVTMFGNMSKDFDAEVDRLNEAIVNRGGKGLFLEVLRRTHDSLQPTLQGTIKENRNELMNLFANNIRRKLGKREEELEEEDSNDIVGMLIPANQVDHKARVPVIFKTVLSTIPARKTNALGLESGANLNAILGKLYTNLAGLQTLDQMRNKLNEGDEQMKLIAETFGLNFDLSSRITSGNVMNALPIMMVQSQFVNHFAKQNVNYFTQQVTKDGVVKFIDEKKVAVIKPMIANWRNAIRKAMRTPGFPYYQDGTTLWDYKKLVDAAKKDGNEVLRVLGLDKLTKNSTQNLGSYLAAQLQSEVTNAQTDIVPAIVDKWSRGNLAMQEELASQGKDLTMNMQNAEGKTINSITEQSGLSKRINELNQTRKTKVEVVSLAGLKTESGTGSVVSDLGPRDSAIVQFNSILKGIVPYVFTGSKSMAWGLQGWRNFESYGDISEITDDYVRYLEKEYNNVVQWVRMNRDNLVLPKGYVTGGGKLAIFSSILPANTVRKLTDDAYAEKTFEKAFKPFTSGSNRKLIERAIQTHVDARTRQLYSKFEKEKIISNTESGYKLFGIDAPSQYTDKSSREGLERLTRDLYVNNELANLEQWQELLGDTSYYKDPLKRITALTATKQNADGVGSLNNYIAFATNTRSSSFVKNQLEAGKQLGQLSNVTIDDIVHAGSAELQKINSKYSAIEIADGQGYGAMEHHRMLGFFEGWWNEDLERIYQHEVNLEKKIEAGQDIFEDELSPAEDVVQYWKVVKTQYFGGQRLENYDGVAPNFLKFSVLPLLPSMTYGQPLDKLRRWMNQTGTPLASIASANKVGRLVDKNTGQGFSGEDFNMEGAEAFVQNLDWKYYGTQTATADEPHTKQTEGTQSAKIVMSDLLSESNVTTYITQKDGSKLPVNVSSRAWINQLLALKSGRIAREFETLKHSLALKDTDNGQYTVSDKEILHAKLIESVQSRSDNKGLLMDLDSIFDSDQPYDYLPKAQLDSLIWGLVKKPIKHKRNGDAKVQVSTAGISVFSTADGTIQQSAELGFYPVGENGTSYAMDVKLPSWYKGNIQIGELTALDSRLAEVIGFRIPTQALASIEYIRVVEFLPKHSNFIVVPAPITGKAGSDFDVDKMNLYYPNVRYNQGMPEYIEYGATSDEDLYVQFINNISGLDLNDEPAQAYKDYKKRLKYRRNYLQGRMMGAGNRINPEIFKSVWSKVNGFAEAGSKHLKGLIKNTKNYTDDAGEDVTLSDKLGFLQTGLEKYAQDALGKDNADVKIVEDILDHLAKYQLTSKVTDKLRAEQAKLQAELQVELNSIQANHYERSVSIAEANGYPTFEQFKAWPQEQKETVEALDNKILEWEKATLAASNNRDHLLSPNQDDNIKRAAYWVQIVNAKNNPQKAYSSEQREQLSKFKMSLADFKKISDKEYAGWQKLLKEAKPLDLINPIFLEDSRQSFQAGKEVLGAIAKAVTHHVLSQVAGLGIMNTGTYKRTAYSIADKKVITQEDVFEAPKFKVKEPLNLGKFKNIDGDWISRILSEYVNASVDVEKDDYIKYINLSIDNASVYMYLLRQGVRPDDVVLFMSQPIISAYTERLVLYNSESYKTQQGITSATQARNKAIEDTILEYGSARKRGENFTAKDLEANIRNPDRQYQAQVFEEYLKSAGIGGMLTQLMGATDFDTKDTGSSYAENALRVYKYEQWMSGNTLFNTKDFNGIGGFMKFIDTDGITKLTPLGQAAKITTTASYLFDDLSVIERQFNYSHLYEDMIQPLLGSMYGVDKVSKAISKLKNGFLTFVLQNTKVDGNLLAEKTHLLTGDNSLASRILALRDMPAYSLRGNYFLEQLEIIKHGEGKVDEVNMRKVMGDEMKTDQLYEAFLEIEDTDPQLAVDLIDYSILRSGVAPSPISYHQAIPIKSIANRYGTLEQYVDTESFKNLFIANNLKDDVIRSAYEIKNDNGVSKLGWYGDAIAVRGDGMYRQDYKVDFEKVQEKRNIGMRERIMNVIGPDVLNYYRKETRQSIEDTFDISPEENVSEAKLKQIIIAIQKAVCR